MRIGRRRAIRAALSRAQHRAALLADYGVWEAKTRVPSGPKASTS